MADLAFVFDPVRHARPARKIKRAAKKKVEESTPKRIVYERQFLLNLRFAKPSLHKPKAVTDVYYADLEEECGHPSCCGSRKDSSVTQEHSNRTRNWRRVCTQENADEQAQQMDKTSIVKQRKVISINLKQEVTLHRSQNAWSRKNTGEIRDTEVLAKQIMGLLNKLSPKNFDKLAEEFGKIQLSTEEHVKVAVDCLFNKAIDEPNYSSLYASLAKRITDNHPQFINLLLQACEEKLHNDIRESSDNGNEEQEQARLMAKRRRHGNVSIVGELLKLQLVEEKAVVEMIQCLVDHPSEQNLESLTVILGKVGQTIDTPCHKAYMDRWFNKIEQLKSTLPSRLRFMFQDVLELRRKNWNTQIEDGPGSIKTNDHASPLVQSEKSTPKRIVYESQFLQNLRFAKPSLHKPKAVTDVYYEDLEEECGHPSCCGSRDDLSAAQEHSNGTHNWRRGCKQENADEQAQQMDKMSIVKQRKVISINLTQEVTLHRSQNAWSRKNTGEMRDTEVLAKQIMGLLNKLSPKNFDRIAEALSKIQLNTEKDVKVAVDCLFNKAIDEPNYSYLYANLAKRMTDNYREFKTLLLQACKEKFYNDIRESSDDRNEEHEQARLKAKRRRHGNLNLVGELLKLELMKEKAVAQIIKCLLDQPTEQNLESLTVILQKVGHKIDRPCHKVHMDGWFNKIEQLKSSSPSRLRFMLQDVLELRQKNWNIQTEESPGSTKTKDHVQYGSRDVRYFPTNVH